MQSGVFSLHSVSYSAELHLVFVHTCFVPDTMSKFTYPDQSVETGGSLYCTHCLCNESLPRLRKVVEMNSSDTVTVVYLKLDLLHIYITLFTIYCVE